LNQKDDNLPPTGVASLHKTLEPIRVTEILKSNQELLQKMQKEASYYEKFQLKKLPSNF
jgi:hypothetical protein